MKHSERAQLVSLLVAFDQSQTGEADVALDTLDLTPETRSQLDEALACLELLERVRRVDVQLSPAAQPLFEEISKGRFLLLRELGRGGLGVVYLARDNELGREVAVKLPSSGPLQNPEARRRFRNEAAAAARLSHPNLVTLYEVVRGEACDLLISEYCAGPTLARWLDDHPSPRDPQQSAELIRDLARAVHYAHERGVLHRDIKPGNVLLELALDEHGAERVLPKLTDFGLAKLSSETTDDTCTGTILGTPAYMAPEQADGRSKQLDVRTDVYGLGAVLYELLTKRPPFSGTSDADTLRQLVMDSPAPPRRWNPDVPRDLQAVCQKCLHREPHCRYATAQALTEDLDRFLAGRPTHARPIGPLRRAAMWARRRPAIAGLTAAVLCAVTALLVGGAFYNLRLRNEVQRANAAQARTEGLLYSSDVGLAYEAWQANDIHRANALLDRHVASPGEIDHREFAWRLLRRRCQPDVTTLTAHVGPVQGVSYSPDGDWLVTAGVDRTARVWDAQTGKPKWTLGGHEEQLTCVRVAPSGDRIATGGDDRTVILWDSKTGAPLRRLHGHSNSVMAIAFARNGLWLASSDLDGVVRVWNPASGELIYALHETSDVIQAIAFAEGDRTLLAADEAGTIYAWRTADGSVVAKTTIPREKLFALAVDPSGQRIAVAGRTEVVHLWSLDQQQLTPAGQLTGGHREWIQGLAFSPSGERLASAGKDGVIRLWDLEQRAIVQTWLGHTARVWSIAWSPDGNALASGSEDGTARVWPVEDEFRAVARSAQALKSCEFAAHDREVWAVGDDRRLYGWQLDSAHATLDRPLSETSLVSLRLSPDRSLGATRTQAGTTQIWRCSDWALLQSIPRAGRWGGALAWVPGTQFVATTLDESTIAIVDADLGRIVRHFRQPYIVRSIAFTPDARTMVVTTHEELQIWDYESQRMTASLRQSYWDLVVSRTGKLAWMTTGSEVACVDLGRGVVMSTMVTIGADANSLDVSPDERTLAVLLRRPDVVSLWDLRTGHELMRLECDDASHLYDVRFSSDGQRLVVVGDDREGRGRVWHWTTAGVDRAGS